MLYFYNTDWPPVKLGGRPGCINGGIIGIKPSADLFVGSDAADPRAARFNKNGL